MLPTLLSDGPWVYSEPSLPPGYSSEEWEFCPECRGGGCHDCDYHGGWPTENAGVVSGEPKHRLSSGESQAAGADHAPAPASSDGFGNNHTKDRRAA